jgi:RHS repeat-associated protein
MLGSASSSQMMVDLPVADRLAWRSRALASWRAVVLAVLLSPLVILALVPGSARAEALCTDSWLGASEATWSTASSWSAGHVPTSTDVACIGAGKTVGIASGSDQAGVVQGLGAVAITGGSLEVANALEPSSIATLSVLGGTLTGAAEVDVTGSFLGGSNGSYVGSGTLVIAPGATGAVLGGSAFFVYGTLINNGSLTVGVNMGIAGGEGAKLVNNALLTINGEGLFRGLYEAGAGPLLVNTGTVQKTEGSGQTEVAFAIKNEGLVTSKTGTLIFHGGGSAATEHAGSWTAASGAAISLQSTTPFALGAEAILSGAIQMSGTTVTVGSIEGAAASLLAEGSHLTVVGPGVSRIRRLEVRRGELTSTGRVNVTEAFVGSELAGLAGSGGLLIEAAAKGAVKENDTISMNGLVVNEGAFTIPVNSGVVGAEGAELVNFGTLTLNGENWTPFGKQTGLPLANSTAKPKLVNAGTIQKIEGPGLAMIQFYFENLGGTIEAKTGAFEITHPVIYEPSAQWGGEENPSALSQEQPTCGEGVNCASGNYSQSQADLTVGGRGVGLNLTRTYNSQAAAGGVHGVFGYGWSSSFSDHLVVESSSLATLVQANGSTVSFTGGSGGTFTAPTWTQDVLSGTEASGYTLTLADQTVYRFAGTTGRLESVTDRNANATTVAYNTGGNPETITDPAGRTIKLAYNTEGLVESATDPLGHVVKYTYVGGSLASVTQPGEAGLRWQFKYDAAHELTELVDGRGGKALTVYNASHQVTEQTDPMSRVTTFEYKPFENRTTNHATGAVTVQFFTSLGLSSATTRGYGTTSTTTESATYDAAGNRLTATDGNGHKTKYSYDSQNNRTSIVDPNNNETKWTYNTTHDIATETKPGGETTTFKRDSHGNPEVIERPAPESKTQATKYIYTAHGQVESIEDPLKRVTKYEYDTAGDKTAEIDPELDKRTWGYNEDSQETSMVSPRGHVKAGEEAKYTTTTERDAQGRPVKVTDPLLHETKYKYDGDSNLEVKTDPEGHETTYTYDADNEQTKLKEPNGTVTETGYDGAGNVTSETDGNKQETKYVRNILEQITESVDPKERKTTKAYDAAGNLKALTDPKGRTTTYTYDAANRPKEVSYSDGKTPAVKYEYNSDGKRTKMTDGTGTTTYGHDQLDRLTETENGHKEITKYGYDLANQQTKITYPNTKAVNREYDKAGRLEKLTDWSSNVTKFGYDADSDLTATTYPTGTTNVDKYAYDEADQMSEVKMTKGAETLASLVYTRNKDGQVKGATSKGLPGEEKPAYEYDTNSRLTKGATIAYKYDAANNPTTIGTGTYKYDKASELETGPSFTYTYDDLGDRTKTKPTSGQATTYGYDQAENLTSVERLKEGGKAEIKDTYTYNGDGLRASQTINGTTTHMAWEEGVPLPLLLNDGTNNYIYGPGGLPVEQIASGGTITYLHHDQQGSTRLLTGSTGTVTGKCTYGAYGTPTCEGTTTTPLGYDAQYTNTDTGLIYLRARYYDPATAQFLSNDPQVMETRAPYAYATDNPLSIGDPTGLTPWSPKVKQAIARCRTMQKRHTYKNAGLRRACEGLLKAPSQIYGTEGSGFLGHLLAAGQDALAFGISAGKEAAIEGCALGAASAIELGPVGATGVCLVSGGAAIILVTPGAALGGAAWGGYTGERVDLRESVFGP